MLPWREYKSPCVDFIIRFAAFTLEFKELKALRRFGTSAKFLRISAFAAFALRECYNSSHRLSGILRRVLPLWRLLYQASFRWQSLRWVLSSANEVKKFVVESERCPEDGYQKCEKLVTCIHQEAESNEQNELNQVEVAPHQNGKSDMSDVDLVGHTETWCSTVNLHLFLDVWRRLCDILKLSHLYTGLVGVVETYDVRFCFHGFDPTPCETLACETSCQWQAMLWRPSIVAASVPHCASTQPHLPIEATIMGMMWGSLSRKICRYASLDAWLHETPWVMLNTRKHPATSSHSCSCLPRPRKDSDGDSALQDWRDVSVQPVFDGKKPISEALVLCLGSWFHQNLWSWKSESCARFQDWLSSLAEENFSKAPGVGSIFGNPSQGLAGVGPTEATTTWYVVGMIYYGWIFHDIPRYSSWTISEF